MFVHVLHIPYLSSHSNLSGEHLWSNLYLSDDLSYHPLSCHKHVVYPGWVQGSGPAPGRSLDLSMMSWICPDARLFKFSLSCPIPFLRAASWSTGRWRRRMAASMASSPSICSQTLSFDRNVYESRNLFVTIMGTPVASEVMTVEEIRVRRRGHWHGRVPQSDLPGAAGISDGSESGSESKRNGPRGLSWFGFIVLLCICAATHETDTHEREFSDGSIT